MAQILVSLVTNCVFLIGCMVPGTVDLALYRVKVAVLAEGLPALALNGNQPQLLHPELPTYWYWGMAGVCDVYDSKSETRCRRQFPPTGNLITIVEESLRDRLGSGQETLINSIVSDWDATLNSIDSSKLRDKEAKFTSESKASAALAILAMILEAGIPFLALASLKLTCGASFFTAMVSVGAGVLAIFSMNDGVHGVVDTHEHGGLGIILLFVGAALRLGSTTILAFYCCVVPRRSDDSETELGHRGESSDDSNREIGFRGEKLMYYLLAQRFSTSSSSSSSSSD